MDELEGEMIMTEAEAGFATLESMLRHMGEHGLALRLFEGDEYEV